MGRIRKRLSAGAKARVALDAVKNEKTVSEIAREHQVHPNRVSEWKKTLIGRASELFERGTSAQDESEQIDRLYRQIGELQVKLEWVKKKSGYVD
jgi:transposase-like protein